MLYYLVRDVIWLVRKLSFLTTKNLSVNGQHCRLHHHHHQHYRNWTRRSIRSTIFYYFDYCCCAHKSECAICPSSFSDIVVCVLLYFRFILIHLHRHKNLSKKILEKRIWVSFERSSHSFCRCSSDECLQINVQSCSCSTTISHTRRTNVLDCGNLFRNAHSHTHTSPS